MSVIRLTRHIPTRNPLKVGNGQYQQRTLQFIRAVSESVNFDIQAAELYKLDTGPGTKTILTREEALTYYRQMLTIRQMETMARNMYRLNQIRGFLHLYLGEEAVAVGIKSVMRDVDVVVTGYRVHGWAYMMGMPMVSLLSELTGKLKGGSRGKGGSMHLYTDKLYGGHGIVGAQVPVGAGLALAIKYMKKNGVAITLYGDGASNQGQVFEAYNMSKLLSLPCVFICENNYYGMGTSSPRSSANPLYYTRGDYIPGIRVNGMDVLAVRESAKFAIGYAASGKGPIIMEVTTYRYSGHSMSDPGTSYRTRDEVKEVRKTKDPITSFKDKIISVDLVNENDLKKIDDEIKKELIEARKVAAEDTDPPVEELTTDIYAACHEPYIRSRLRSDEFKHFRLGKPLHQL